MKVIITGGAGFIGSNAASRYIQQGHDVIVMDNLAREGSRKNLDWLKAQGAFEFVHLDLRDVRGVAALFHRHRDADRVLHLAGQVAVTTSVTNPREDFEINALGALNVLEAMRMAGVTATAIYSSTNKVYGEMRDADVVERGGRYDYSQMPFGISEERLLDFHSPYGCSKGTADQYFIDYHRIYGIRTVVFRQSCIYGYRQFGAEDQGWIAWFMIASQLGRPIKIFGDGKQIRDILFIDDLLDAYDAAFVCGERAWGRAFNIGGGPGNTASLLELVNYIERRQGRNLKLSFGDWRPGDQKVFISDVRRAHTELGWTPRISCEQGMTMLYDWIADNLHMFAGQSSNLQTVGVR